MVGKKYYQRMEEEYITVWKETADILDISHLSNRPFISIPS